MKMKLKRRSGLAAAVLPIVALCLTPAAHSQRASGSGSSNTSAGAAATQEAETRSHRASGLIGSDLVDPQREKLGEIRDLVINLANGEVRYVAVSLDTSPERIYALPLHAVRVPPSGNNAVLDTEKAERGSLAKMPSWSNDNWPALSDSGYWAKIDRIGGLPQLEPDQIRFARASDLIGQDVRNPQGTSLGKLEDLVVGMDRQRVHYAVLAFDPGLLATEQLFPYPVSRFTPEPDGKGGIEHLVLKANPDRLRQLGGFPPNDWPLVNRAGRTADLNRYLSFRETDAPNASFDSLDFNRDGFLSRNEAQGDRDAMQRWSTLDRNRDDRLSRDEYGDAPSASTGQ